jgi:hypothetical protein
MTVSHQSVPAFNRDSFESAGSAQMGTATSNVRPTSIPVKLAAVTPTISTG